MIKARTQARGWLRSWSRLALLPALALAACGHDAERANPLDPVRTPPLALTASLDDTLGVVRLAWSAYDGVEPVAELWVLRRAQGSDAIDTIRVADLAARGLADTVAANTAYLYRVAVVNRAGLVSPSAEVSVPAVTAGPVRLIDVTVDPRAGRAAIVWTRYRGPRFAAYRVERRDLLQEDYDVVARLETVDDTTATDAALEPGHTYRYRIAVEATGSAWTSAPSGRDGFVLEPAALLPARADPLKGTIDLVWTRYEGPGFGAYRLLRRTLGRTAEDTLAVLADPGHAAWTDSAARSGVDYEYRVVVDAAGQALRSAGVLGRLDLPGVSLGDLEFDAATATAHLAWEAYRGPRFAAYRVLRTAGGSEAVVAVLDDPQAAAFVDSHLVGATRYRYAVDVETTLGETVVGRGDSGGGFHLLVAEWPLEVAPDGGARLVVDDGGHLWAVLTDAAGVRVVRFAAEGSAQLHLQVLAPDLDPAYSAWEPERGCLTLGGLTPGTVGLACFDEAGEPLASSWQPLFAGELPRLEGTAALVAPVFGLFRGTGITTAAFDTVTIRVGGGIALADGFEGGVRDEWTSVSSQASVRDGALWSRAGAGSRVAQFRHPGLTDSSAVDLEIETWATVNAFGLVGVEIGSPSTQRGSWLSLALGGRDRVARLGWRHAPPIPGQVSSYQRWQTAVPLPIWVLGLRLGIASGRVEAAMTTPVIWGQTLSQATGWASLARLGDQLVVGLEDTLRAEGPKADFEAGRPAGPVAELRAWRDAGGDWWLGRSLPAQNLVAVDRTAISFLGQVVLPANTGGPIGAGLGSFPGQLLAPISFDVAADGRVFVLDAGNHRVQSFTPEGRPITRWGEFGLGPGQFHLSGGLSPRDFRGSLAVGDDGSVYVADPVAGRIQVFTP